MPIFLLLLICSCTSTIIPSQDKGRTVAILDHGRHSSLIIEHDNKLYRYSYGDWDFYAQAQGTFFNGLKALFWPTQGALGRKQLEGLPTLQNIERQLKIGTEEILLVDANPDKVEALKRELDKIYYDNQSSLLFNTEYDLEFVHHPETYWAFNNSNQMIGRWLEAVGVKVKGLSLYSRWEVVGE